MTDHEGVDMTNRICTVEGCQAEEQLRRHMCHQHYDRWLRATPLADRERPAVGERFSTKTRRDAQTGCLLWTGALDPRGYGCFAPEGHERQFAHRISLERKLGRPIAPGMFACHRCDTPSCVEPEHLYEGTHQQNVDDSVKQLRHAWGARNGHTKLTNDDVRDIRDAASSSTQADLARRYGVTSSTISRIVKRERWALLDPVPQ